MGYIVRILRLYRSGVAAHIARPVISLAARAQRGSDKGLMKMGDIDTSCTLTVITPVSRVLSARVAHGNEMPVTLLERHARKLAVVLLRNASEVRDTCRWLRPALGQGRHCVRVAHRAHTT